MSKIRTVIADPPWNEQGGGKIKRGADKHYPLMKTPDIIKLMTAWYAKYEHEDDQHIYLWVSNNFLVDGLSVMEALGFRYITNVVWVKDSMGLGQYFRGQHEICLFGVRGRGFEPRTALRNIPSIFKAKKREHSRKPEEFYQLVEARSHGPYLEMFARASRGDLWTAEGNETTKFNADTPIDNDYQ